MLRIEPINVRPIVEPRWNNTHVRVKALWLHDNAVALGDYYAQLVISTDCTLSGMDEWLDSKYAHQRSLEGA